MMLETMKGVETLKYSPIPESNFATTDLEAQKAADARGYFAVKHNDIIQRQKFQLTKNGGNSMSLLEQKALLYIISQIKPEDTELRYVEFTIKDFYAVCGIDARNGDNYRYFKEVITKLASRTMWLVEPDTETIVRWIDKAIIYKNNGTIKIRLDSDLQPYLLMLSKNYTKIPLRDVIRMKSKYGIMLYELLKSYAYMGMRMRFDIQDLKEKLDCVSYANFTNFRKYVLEPALNDINKYSEIMVDYELVKTGRTYTDIIFTIKDLEKSKRLEDQEEVARRHLNVEREIDPNQVSLWELLNEMGEG